LYHKINANIVQIKHKCIINFTTMIRSKVNPNPNRLFVDALYKDIYKIDEYRRIIINTFRISKETLNSWLNGRIKIRPVYYEKIAEILNVPVSVLFPDVNV